MCTLIEIVFLIYKVSILKFKVSKICISSGENTIEQQKNRNFILSLLFYPHLIFITALDRILFQCNDIV